MATTETNGIIPIDSVVFVKELYPRLKEDEAAIERYRLALDKLPPIVVARKRILVDGFHRWMARKKEGQTELECIDLGDLSDAEILRESITRNASHGQQLSREDKKKNAVKLWLAFAGMDDSERTAEIEKILSVSVRSIQLWTKEIRDQEKEELKAKVFDLWLDCLSERDIAERVGVTQPTVGEWVKEKRKSAETFQALDPRNLKPDEKWPYQHFDIWQFPKANGDSTYFGKMPPQVVENLLWFYTNPGDVVVDPFAGGGTTIGVAKDMGRRVFASDIAPSNPLLPIHQHDITTGWHPDAPKKAKLILLDPPYWSQAKGRYSDHESELGNMDLKAFYDAWVKVVTECAKHVEDGGVIAYIISPSEDKENDVVVDHATDMLYACWDAGLRVKRRIIVPYSTQQATGQQVTWAREKKRMLKLYRDLVILSKE